MLVAIVEAAGAQSSAPGTTPARFDVGRRNSVPVDSQARHAHDVLHISATFSEPRRRMALHMWAWPRIETIKVMTRNTFMVSFAI